MWEAMERPPGWLAGPTAALLALLAAPLAAAGLALLRLSSYGAAGRPALAQLVVLPEGPSASLGALLLLASLACGSLPMLTGAAEEGQEAVAQERKAALVVQCTQVLLCWAAERYLLQGRALPGLQSYACGVVWLGSTLVEWAGPVPHDDMSGVLRNQFAGCDGGYRTNFLLYIPTWVTVLTFGTLLVNCVDGSRVCDFGDDAASDEEVCKPPADASTTGRHAAARTFRQMALPVVYGFATSMAGLLFAAGVSEDSQGHRWAAAGAALLLLAAACAWDWFRRLGLTLAAWAPLSQAAASLARLVQGHLLFRDFRWAPMGEYGLLLVWRRPGMQLFLLGMVLLTGTLVFYLWSCDWQEWSRSVACEEEETPSLGLGRQLTFELKAQLLDQDAGSAYCLQWLLLLCCFGCFINAISVPLVLTYVTTPEVQWLDGDQAIERFKRSAPDAWHREEYGYSYIDVISSQYAHRMPFSALVSAYTAVIMPPIQFFGLFVVLAHPSFVPAIVLKTLRAWLLNEAPFKFCTPMVFMLTLALVNLSDPGGATFHAAFTRGLWYYLAYCVTFGILVRQLAAEDAPGEARSPEGLSGEGDVTHGESREVLLGEEEGSSSEEEEAASPVEGVSCRCFALRMLGFTVLLAVLGYATYVALVQPFMFFDFRFSGAKLMESEPSLMDLWFSLSSVSFPLAAFAAVSLILALLARVALLLLRLLLPRRDPADGPLAPGNLVHLADDTLKPWVLGHVWSFSILLLYYIFAARNRDVQEVCARLPDPPVGLAAIAVMGVGVPSISHLVGALARAPFSSSRTLSGLPGGVLVWVCGPIVVSCFWLALLYVHGPQMPPEITGVGDVNRILSTVVVPRANDRIRTWLPESKGDCEALFQHRLGRLQEERRDRGLRPLDLQELDTETWPLDVVAPGTCNGHSPLAHMKGSKDGMDVTVRWATGLNDLNITDFCPQGK